MTAPALACVLSLVEEEAIASDLSSGGHLHEAGLSHDDGLSGFWTMERLARPLLCRRPFGHQSVGEWCHTAVDTGSDCDTIVSRVGPRGGAVEPKHQYVVVQRRSSQEEAVALAVHDSVAAAHWDERGSGVRIGELVGGR